MYISALSIGSRRENKNVMFSDGIRPGGDLTELDGSSEIPSQPRRTGRRAKKVEPPKPGRTETLTSLPWQVVYIEYYFGLRACIGFLRECQCGCNMHNVGLDSPPAVRAVTTQGSSVSLVPDAGLPPVCGGLSKQGG